MKSLLLVGGVLGWGVGMGSSIIQGNSWPDALLHGSLAAYGGALLLRWWGRTWRKSLAQSIREREQAEYNLMAAATSNQKVSRS